MKWKPGFRHHVTMDSGGPWRCVDCGQEFETFPSDGVECLGPRDEGLHRKYQVLRHDGRDGAGQKHEGCEYFVLDLTHDSSARTAALQYALICGDERLAADLVDQVNRIDNT